MKSKEKEKGKSKKSADKEEKKRKEERKAEKAERKAEKARKQETKGSKSGKNKKKKEKNHEKPLKNLKSGEGTSAEKAAETEKEIRETKAATGTRMPVEPKTAVPENTAAESKAAKKKSTALSGKAASPNGETGSEKTTPGDMEVYAEVFRALSDESRIQILKLLAGKELCGAELLELVPIVQSTLSHHMKVLCESGLVSCRKQGRWAYYTLDKRVFAEVADCLKRQTEE